MQQIKVERGISFPGARKAALSEQSTNTSSKRTAASVVSGSTTATTQHSQKSTISIAIQTELTWPVGTDTPVPVKVSSQSTQTTSQRKKTSSPSPPPRSNKAANADKGGKGNIDPQPSTSSTRKGGKPKIHRPPPHTDDQIAMYSRYGVLDVEGGGDSDAE